ncbi:unnamed protein product [Ilex paraguariensis]|uniref:Uncharacterized protein n=1 Tax=Ilex paraguariensis TaxID=185542 RepID=A0ABC8T079_9AQUA
MGLFTYTLAGGGFIMIGGWEALISSEALKLTPPSQSLPPIKSKTAPISSSVSFLATSLFSFFFILNSLISLIDALNSKDNTGLALQLGVIAIAALFFLYSVLGLLTNMKTSFQLPSSILNLLCLFAFSEEFVLFYFQRKDPSGIENRYFDLLLVPIAVCVFSTILELKTLKSNNYARMSRGIGLILQGTWFIQMGFSLYSDLIAHGCSLHEKSRGNYTVRCKGHPEYHRGRAIATLQFNCHLALVVVLIVGVYSIFCKKNGVPGDFTQYRPLGAEMRQLDGRVQFTLDSDDDDDVNGNGIREENVEMQKAVGVVPESRINVGRACKQPHFEQIKYMPTVIFSAIKTYQLNYNLTLTRNLDAPTVAKMMVPRCEVADIINGTNRMRGVGKKSHAHVSSSFHTISDCSFFYNYRRWPNYKTHLTYGFLPGTHPNVMTASVTRFTFSWTSNYAYADLKVSFESRDHGDGMPFDSPTFLKSPLRFSWSDQRSDIEGIQALYYYHQNRTRWPNYKTHLTYGFLPGTHPNVMTASVTRFTFSWTSNYAYADLKVSFESHDHGDGIPFDIPTFLKSPLRFSWSDQRSS